MAGDKSFIKNLENKLKNIKESNNHQVVVGWEDEEMSLIAATLEFGTHNAGKGNHTTIPPRPHRYNAIKMYKKKWIADLEYYLVKNNYAQDKTLKQIGNDIRKDWVDSIKDGDYTALAASTLKARKSANIRGTKPLVATRKMLNTLSFRIEKK